MLKPPLKKFQVGGAGILICCLGHHFRTFSALKLLPAHFCNSSSHFDLICLETHLPLRFRPSIWHRLKKKLQVGGAGILICYLGHHSETFSKLKLLLAHFAILSDISEQNNDYSGTFDFEGGGEWGW